MHLSLVCKGLGLGRWPYFKREFRGDIRKPLCLNLAKCGTSAGPLNSEKRILSIDLVAKLNIFWDMLWF